MRHKMTFLVFLLTISTSLIAQTTIELSPSRDLYITNFPSWEGTNLSPDGDFAAVAWTSSGTPFLGRSMMAFDLSVVPDGAAIVDARLSLFANPNPEHSPGHSTRDGSNLAFLRRIIEPWSETATTWQSQPSTTSTNEVYMPMSISVDQDYLDIDVTALIVDIHNNQESSHGFMFQLQTEVRYRALNFASKNTDDSTKIPKLQITYTTEECITITSNDGNGQDLYVSNFPSWENTNLNPDGDFAAVAWTSGGTPFLGRSMMDFDLSSIPEDAEIFSAHLDLYANPYPEHSPSHSTSAGSNEATLKRITTPWDENETTWNSQPSTTDQNAVAIPASILPDQNYLNIDVTELIRDMHQDQENSHGFLFKLNTEVLYRALNFASGNCKDSTLVPTLSICYSDEIDIPNVSDDIEIELFPNPAEISVHVRLKNLKVDEFDALIINSQGKCVKRIKQSNAWFTLDVSNLTRGMYFVQIQTNGSQFIAKLAVQ